MIVHFLPINISFWTKKDHYFDRCNFPKVEIVSCGQLGAGALVCEQRHIIALYSDTGTPRLCSHLLPKHWYLDTGTK